MSAVAIQGSAPPARIVECTQDEYFADAFCALPSLNQSTAHVLLTKSPLHAWATHPRLGNVIKRTEREPTKAQIQGTVLHALLLGKGSESVCVLGYDDYRSKAAQADKAIAVAQGRTPILARDYDEAVEAADMIRGRLAEQGCVFEGGQAEVAIEWTEESDEGPVLCRGRLDYLIVGDNWAKVIDPKKIVDADELSCMRHADDYGHHLQAAAYTSAVEKLYPQTRGRVEFVFAFMELEAPHCAVPRPTDAMSRWVGEQQWKRAYTMWQQCMNAGVWPGYPALPLSVTPWTMRQEEEIAGVQ